MLTIEQQSAPAHPQQPVHAGFGEYFRYHGWLSPGVRLFRSLSFQSKSLWISAAFTTPLILLLYFIWGSASAQIDSTGSERQGLIYTDSILKLVKSAQLVRLAASSNPAALSGAQQQERSAYAELATQQAALGKDFNVEAAYGEVKRLHDQLQTTPQEASPEATFMLHNGYIDAVQDLGRRAADGSQLTLDPDLDTFHMMNIAVLRGPQLLELTARLRGEGMLTLRQRTLSPAVRDSLVEALAIQKMLSADIANSQRQGLTGDAAGLLDLKGIADALATQRDLLKHQVLGTELGSDAAGYLAASNHAVDLQMAGFGAVAKALDLRLARRIDNILATFRSQAAISLLCVAFAAYLLLAFYKVMMGGLQEVAGHLEQITEGNLTTVPQPWGSDEAARLMLALGKMQLSLRRMATVVLDSSASVQVASEEIAAASADLSSRTEDSAANLEETAASMEQISATVKNSHAAVNNAAAIVNSNAQAAARGGAVMLEVVSTMEGIQASARKIEEIITVIDGIAFQTNILALNAAVEAARAGEQGRGFAVVASEVRNLAHRSATAAKEIKILIGESLQQVNAGSRVAAEAGRTINTIVENARNIDALINEISRSSAEQSSRIAQVSNAIDTLDQSTQQNAALVEETAAASATLSEQAQKLSMEIAFFKLK